MQAINPISTLVRRRLTAFLIVLLAVSSPVVGFAEDIRFEAAVDRTQVELGSFLQLTLSVQGVRNVDPPELPRIDGVESRYLGPSTNISIVNGRYSGSVAFRYNLYPLKVGQFRIPALTVNIDGREYASEPITFEVVNASSSGFSGGGGAALNSLQEKLFVTIKVPQPNVYLHQKVPLTIKLYKQGLNLKNIEYPLLDAAGVMTDSYEQPRQYEEVVGGLRWNVVEFHTFIYPTRTGRVAVGPATINGQVIFQQKSRRERLFSGADSLLEDDLFQGFFQTYDVRPISVTSSDLELNVLPLPEKGRPAGFSGAVGTFDFDLSVGPQEVKVGDPVTVRMRVSGDGDFKMFTMPELKESDDFKLYDPKVSDEKGAKELEQVVIPRTENVTEFPEVRFSYFDIASGTYQTITRGPLSLKVSPVESGAGIKVVGWEQGKPPLTVPEHLGRDISFIKSRPGRFVPLGYHLYKDNLFRLMTVVYLVLWTGAYLYYRIRRKLKSDEHFARRLQAPREARTGLKRARQLMDQQDPQAFYDILFKTLQTYLSHRFHIPSGAVTLDAVDRALQGKKRDEKVFRDLGEVFADCEMVRYASAAFDRDRMHASYRKTAGIIDALERI